MLYVKKINHIGLFLRKLKMEKKFMKEKMEPFYFTDIDMDIRQKLSDSVLRPKYIGQKSVQSKLRNMREKISALVDTEEKVDNIMNVIIDDIIPAGTKGNVRGLEFNHIIKSMLEMKMEPNHQFNLSFETNCPVYSTSEIPDWWIHCKLTNKYVIGYNQIDLWNGGSQINRANKYLSDDFHDKTPWNVRILCVVCSQLPLKKNTNKYEMFSNAFLQQRICYTSAMIDVVKKLLL